MKQYIMTDIEKVYYFKVLVVIAYTNQIAEMGVVSPASNYSVALSKAKKAIKEKGCILQKIIYSKDCGSVSQVYEVLKRYNLSVKEWLNDI